MTLEASFGRNYNVSPFASAQTQHRRALQTHREVERKNPRREPHLSRLAGGFYARSGPTIVREEGNRWEDDGWIRCVSRNAAREEEKLKDNPWKGRVTSVKGFDVYRAATPALAFSNGPVRGTFT
ncbi:hypothetical protein K0M31_001368 [Melipona bicolor]|uniref:Uncharacterized protein n=1 Tax=Melipona bicolor TaxID=60889 RepID=A0AA40KY45_9HYME|nr:hypothetical protein K0M31_001368 [Melipona bicolor]